MTDLKLSGSRVIVSGGGSGIGLAVAAAFLREGAKVDGHDATLVSLVGKGTGQMSGAPFAPFGLLGCQARAGTSHSPPHRFHHLGDDRKLADVMLYLPEHLPEGFRRERRAIGRDAQQRQVACLQGRV